MAKKLYKCLKVASFKLDPESNHENELVERGLYHLDEEVAKKLVKAGVLEEVAEEGN